MTPRTIVTLAPISGAFSSPWYALYEAGLQEGFAAHGVRLVDSRYIASYGGEPCILMAPWDAAAYAASFKPRVMLSHVHGAPSIPFGNWSVADHELEAEIAKLCTVLVNSVHSKTHFEGRHHVHARVVGFPLPARAPCFRPPGPYKHILVPGRMDIDRIPMVILEALAGQVEYPIVFCTPGGRPAWMKSGYLDHPHFSRVRVEPGVTVDGYHRLLADAACVVIGSQFDTLNLSAVQSLLAGVHVVAPDSGPFPEFVAPEFRYSPYDLGDIRYRVACALGEEPPNHTRAALLTDPVRVAARYLEAIEEVTR